MTAIHNKAANIKVTKQRYLNLIEQDAREHIKFSSLFEEYSKEYNNSEQICFLAILHLCNEQNYEIEGDVLLTDFTLRKRL